MTSTKQTSTCSVTNTNGTRQPIEISPIAISSDNPHFAHDGISNSPCARWPVPGPARALKIHNRRKRLRLQARTAHKRTVNLHLRHQPPYVVGFDAAAVEDAKSGGPL